jgi:hypothetical protein
MNHDNQHPFPIADHTGAVHLTPTLTAYSAINPDGTETFWLHDHTHHDTTTVCPTPDHERAGRLPHHIRRLVNPCAGRTRTGRPCRNPSITPAGNRCHQHAH